MDDKVNVMKKNILIICLTFFSTIACRTDTSNVQEASDQMETNHLESSSENIEDTNVESSEETEEMKPVSPPPPPSPERVANEKKESSKSIFLSLGCCEKEADRLNDCCCMEVLDKYKTLSESKDPKLGEYKMKDPILGNCRRKLAKEFELVDYPPAKAGEEDYDDLF